MSEIKRKRSESFDAFMRRVKRRWQQSGKLLQARKVQFFVEKKSKNVQRDQRVKYIKRVKKEDYLRKIGRLRDDDKEIKRKRKR